MARILIANTSWTGHVTTATPIVRTLVSRGHDVRWYTGERFRAKVERTGATWVPMVHAPHVDEETYDRDFPGRAGASMVDNLKTALTRVFGDSMPGQLEDLSELHRTWPPDVVLADPTFFGVTLYHERSGVPYATCGLTVLAMRSRDTAPTGLCLPPSRTPLGRLRNRLLHAFAEKVLFADVQRHLSAVRERAGFGPLPAFFFLQTSPFLFLQPTVPSFEYPRSDLASTVHFIGPLVDTPPVAWEPPAWWPDFGAVPPVVHVTQGTLSTDASQLIVPTIQALAGEDVLLVITTGGKPVDSIALPSLPPNVRVEPFIPHPRFMPFVDVMITNGGYGGVQAALVHGAPLVVAGTSEEKPEVARHVEWAGVGLDLKTATPTPEQIRRAVRTILGDRRFEERSRAIQAECERYDGPARGADLLEQLVATRRPVAGGGDPRLA